MSSEIAPMIHFQKVPRCYRTERGWRLATYKEARDNLDMIKDQQLLKDWERARLLNGWISGPHHNYEMGDGYRGSIGYMLVIQISGNNGGSEKELYAEVSLDRAGKEMALLLCSEDWNYEVVYWVLNSLAETEAAKIDATDVRAGNIPFPNTQFQELNKMVNDFARTMGESPASEKAANKKFSRRSIKEVLLSMWSSCLNKVGEAYQKPLGRLYENMIVWNAHWISGDLVNFDRLPNFASQGDVSDTIWNFTWEYLSSKIITEWAHRSLYLLIKEWADCASQPTTARKNFLVSTYLLLHLSDSKAMFGFEKLKYVLKHATEHVELFKRRLQDGSYWHRYDTENYSALEKALHVSAYNWGSNPIMMNKMLEYGAQPLSKVETQTVLHWAVLHSNSEDEVNEFARRLFAKCNAKEELANAVSKRHGTALHLASSRGFARTCELLLHYGGKPDAQNEKGKIPLHFAVEERMDEVIDVLVRRGKNDEAQSEDAPDINQNRIDMVNFKDREGKSPLDIGVQQNNMKVVAKLLAISEQPVEDYFDKVDRGKLLRQFALEGNTDIVGKLLKSEAKPDDVDEEGKTTLHYIAMSEDRCEAVEIYGLIRKPIPKPEIKSLVAMCDFKGRTALHLAAEKGNEYLCRDLNENQEIQSMKDQDGQSPIYYAVKGNHDNVAVINAFCERSGGMIDDNLVDSTGLTPLHVAATAGKIYLADALLSSSKDPKSYVKKPDFLGQTALHKACKEGHIDTIKVLLHWGAEPHERDCDGRTALHYAVQIQSEEKGMIVVQLLLKRFKLEEKKLLFLWASAAGLGTADENLKDSPLKNFLQREKKDAEQNLRNAGRETNLIRIAASTGDIEMTKELLTRGGQMSDIQDKNWREGLHQKLRDNVEKVLKQIQSIVEQGNDQPTMDDNLGRYDFACGLAALLLNPCLIPPINVGISGKWGNGKSSLMKQTEIMLLKTTAQLVLLPSLQLSTLDFPGAKNLELSKTGKSRIREIERQIKLLKDHEKFNGDSFVTKMKKVFKGHFLEKENCFVTLMKKIGRQKTTKEESNKEDEHSLLFFLNNYEVKYHNIFKSLAAMDSSCMFTKIHDSPMEESVPAVLTVQYNAWKYRNDKEALAGMAVEITREMERTMTLAQWISTSWRNSWEKQKQDIWTTVIFRCILAVLLAGTFTCIVWLLLDRSKFKRSEELKYASLPVTILITVWTLVKSVMNTVNPVSTQLMNYIQFPNHAENLGYQEKVISDINFLKREVGRKPFLLCTIAAYIWDLVNAFSTLSFLCLESFGEVKVFNASVNPRIIVFVDDLDRCHESVILQVLSAINLVLAVCEISVIVGMDRALIERAIFKKYGDKNLKGGEELADQYLQKIIQLPLDLPEPDQPQSNKFLKRQLGVFEEQRMDKDQNEDAYDHTKEDEDYNALFSEFDKFDTKRFNPVSVMKDMFRSETSTSGANISEGLKLESGDETNARENKDVVIPMDASVVHSYEDTRVVEKASSDMYKERGDQSLSKIIPIKKMLFIRYSEGERDAFCYFQGKATGCRKLPREWKRLLNYHRLVWNIFSMSDEVKHLDGWQVQLIAWIFICWEWQENMNIPVEEWNTIDILKTTESYELLSLKVIVADVIKNKRWFIKENMSKEKFKEGAMKEKEGAQEKDDLEGNISVNSNN